MNTVAGANQGGILKDDTDKSSLQLALEKKRNKLAESRLGPDTEKEDDEQVAEDKEEK